MSPARRRIVERARRKDELARAVRDAADPERQRMTAIERNPGATPDELAELEAWRARRVHEKEASHAARRAAQEEEAHRVVPEPALE